MGFGIRNAMPRPLAVLAIALALAATATSARAASPSQQALLVSCDAQQRSATFEGRIATLARAARMQLRFTLQVRTPDQGGGWHAVRAPGFGSWIVAPAGIGRYIYDKTVQKLLAPAQYRAVVDFRWRAATGRVVRSARATSPSCRQPDARPRLRLSALRLSPHYGVRVSNRGRSAAAAFAVDFSLNGAPLGTVQLAALAAGASTTATLQAPACRRGDVVSATVDPGSALDAADAPTATISVTC